MRGRASIYFSLLLIVGGLLFLAANVGGPWLGIWWGQLWPGLLLLLGIATCLPIFVWWEERRNLSPLLVPGVIFAANAAIFGYNTLTGDWDAWAYLWTLEPLAVGAGLFATWLVGPRHALLLWAAGILAAVSLVLFAVFGALFGSPLAGVMAPIVLIALGLFLLARGLRRRAGRPAFRS